MKKNTTPSRLRLLPLLALLTMLSGCATVHGPTDERDPWEGFNRSMHQFNDTFDRAILKPVAEVYQDVVPSPINRGISNFFSNLGDVVVLANDLLQLKFHQAASDFSRIVFNTTFGLAGFVDVATPMGLPRHNEDFGQTLGYWGVGSGPYLVLPFLGSQTLRDSAALPADWRASPQYQVDDSATVWGAVALYGVDSRAGLLGASRLLEQAALDPYVFMRDAYLQRRENLVYDGNPPMADFDPFDDPFGDPLDDPGVPLLEDPSQSGT